MNKLILLLVLALIGGSCAMMARMGAVGAGAATGAAVAGPVGAVVGGTTALASVEVYQAEGEVEAVEEELVQAKETIRQLTEGDVLTLINQNSEGTLATIWKWIKIIVGGAVVLFVGNIIYTLKRKGYAKKYYTKIDKYLDNIGDSNE